MFIHSEVVGSNSSYINPLGAVVFLPPIEKSNNDQHPQEDLFQILFGKMHQNIDRAEMYKCCLLTKAMIADIFGFNVGFKVPLAMFIMKL